MSSVVAPLNTRGVYCPPLCTPVRAMGLNDDIPAMLVTFEAFFAISPRTTLVPLAGHYTTCVHPPFFLTTVWPHLHLARW